MEILIVVATPGEILPFKQWMERNTVQGKKGNLSVSILETGIGMVNTAYAMGHYFGKNHIPDLCIGLGIAGSFKSDYPIGGVVEVRTENFSGLGAEDGGQFIGLEEMGFENFKVGEEVYYNELSNSSKEMTQFKNVRGITVNKVHGNAESIQQVIDQIDPDIESMESAAFFQSCMMAAAPFVSLRGISNRVEPRDKSKWKIKDAIENVNQAAIDLILKLSGEKQ